MGLIKQELNEKIARFREFDEAKGVIENFKQKDAEDIFAAIDYMLVHKEYYYLLKTIYRFCNEIGIERVASYLFARLECLGRDEDKKMLKRVLLCPNKGVRQSAFSYILGCCEQFDIVALCKEYPLAKDDLAQLLEFGECEGVRRYVAWLREDFEQKMDVIKEFTKLYGEGNE